ncbi:Retrotransposon-derived protein PEG10 [Rhizoctonia solani]|uniref:Retrotransposon-derived protein PEG10 n=1 Tax=Rhizoctonia solani TaxID=456999 RepID=A0A8H8SXY2_9AGAM|nr:Retrotransposon-derived protein PEG10 [Rhizoctonia solani]QRW22616.1 Retrotransposon-derived protein PEG10 [Rhizoctonia solani]
MEPEPSPASPQGYHSPPATVGSLQDQIRAQSQQITKLRAICKETVDLLGDKDQGAPQTKPGPLTGPITPPTQTGGKPTLQQRLGLAQGPFPPFRGTGYDSEEEEDRQAPKREPCNTPKRSLSSLTPFDAGSSVKQPKMELPNPYKGNTRDQFDDEEQMVVWILYHMTDKVANWALPLIGNIIKGEGNPPSTILALTAKFKEAFANPNAKRAAARKIAALTQTSTTSKYFTRGLHWKVKELLSTKDNIPNNDLEAIFAALVKIDNTRWENKENRPKKAPVKPSATVATSTTTTRSPIQGPQLCHPRRKGPPPRIRAMCQVQTEGTRDQAVPQWLESHNQEAAKIGEVVELEKE